MPIKQTKEILDSAFKMASKCWTALKLCESSTQLRLTSEINKIVFMLYASS